MGTENHKNETLVNRPSNENMKGKSSKTAETMGPGSSNKKKKKEDMEENELSEEDRALKEKIDTYVSKIQDTTLPADMRLESLNALATELKTATDSMSAVPKQLKFLRIHFVVLQEAYINTTEDQCKRFIADLLSVLGTTNPPTQKNPPVAASPLPPKTSVNAPTADCNTEGGLPRNDKDNTKADQNKVFQTVATDSASPKFLALRFRLLGGVTPLVSWGIEYLTCLSGDIWMEHNAIMRGDIQEGVKVDDESPLYTATLPALSSLIDEIVPYYMSKGAEIDAIDLLTETDSLEKVVSLVGDNYQRAVDYITATAAFAPSQEAYHNTLKVAYDILFAKRNWPNALRIALKLSHEPQLLKRVLHEANKTDQIMLKQLAMLLHRQRVTVNWEELESGRWGTIEDSVDSTMPVADQGSAADEKISGLEQLAGGVWLSPHYLHLAKELDVLEPKTPEDIYKSHLEDRSRDTLAGSIDSAKQNLAATYLNGFVNLGFCTDTLMTAEGSSWLYRNRDHGMTAAAASVGLINLWNMNEGLAQADKLQWSNDTHVKAGALMAFGIFDSTTRTEWDSAFALLSDHVGVGTVQEQLCTMLGLGLAYAGTRRLDITETLVPIAIDMSHSTELAAASALALGLINVSSCSEDVAEVLVQALIDRSNPPDVDDAANPPTNPSPSKSSSELSFEYLICVGLGLLYLGRREDCDGTLLALSSVHGQVKNYAMTTVEGMAYAGTGDVLKVQRMLQHCVESKTTNAAAGAADKGAKMVEQDEPTVTAGQNEAATAEHLTAADNSENKLEEAVAVLNIAMIAFGESTGTDMVTSLLDHVLQYANINTKRAVPLAIALHSVSQPKPQIVDTLSKLSHDQDPSVALHAIFALGLVGAGTNNARIATLLRQLATYYGRDSNGLFTVRIAQGFLYMGKGLVTINPLHSDGLLIDSVGFASLITLLHIAIQFKPLILGRQHVFLYTIVPAIYPRMLITVDEDLKPIAVPVRVGQAVNVVGVAGNPRRITGFQTHNTPVIIGSGDRVELANEDFEPLSPVLEGVIILRKKPATEEAANTE